MSRAVFRPVTHVIFDMDGTLIDTERIHKKTFTKIVKEFGKEFPEDLRTRILGMQEIDCATLIVVTLQLDVTPQAFLEKCRTMEEKEMGNVKLMHGKQAYTTVTLERGKKTTRKPLRPYTWSGADWLSYRTTGGFYTSGVQREGVEALLEHFRRHRIPMAVATSSSETAYRTKTRHLKDQFDVFHHVVTGSSDPEVKRGKPAPDIFKICASRFPDNPLYSECLVFEDSPNGVSAAIAAGMQVVMVPDPTLPKELTADATLTLDSLEDFRPEMFSLPAYFIQLYL